MINIPLASLHGCLGLAFPDSSYHKGPSTGLVSTPPFLTIKLRGASGALLPLALPHGFPIGYSHHCK